MIEEQFPILGDLWGYVPYATVAKHEAQAHINHNASVAALRMRGGITWVEMYYLLRDETMPPVGYVSDYYAQAEVIKMADL